MSARVFWLKWREINNIYINSYNGVEAFKGRGRRKTVKGDSRVSGIVQASLVHAEFPDSWGYLGDPLSKGKR